MSYITLDELRVASPCSSAVWSKEKAERFASHCKTCDKNVHNLSLMTLDEANDLIQEKQGNLCVTLYHGLNGKVLTSDAPIGFKAFRRTYLKVRAAVIGLVLGLWGLITGTTSCSQSVANGIFLDPDKNFNAFVDGSWWQPYQSEFPEIAVNDTTKNEIWINSTKSDSSSLWIFLDSTERAPGTYENHHGIFEAGGYKNGTDTSKYIWYAGELKITSFSSSHVTGTFGFNAKRTSPSVDTVFVTNGNFDVPINIGQIPR